jgi:hypothetical protein
MACFAEALHCRTRELSRSAHAGVAQLVEHELPKLGVAGSSPVSRSISAYISQANC